MMRHPYGKISADEYKWLNRRKNASFRIQNSLISVTMKNYTLLFGWIDGGAWSRQQAKAAFFNWMAINPDRLAHKILLRDLSGNRPLPVRHVSVQALRR